MHDLWNWVEAKAFNPRTEKDKLKWLRCFHRFIPRLWETHIFDWQEWNKPENTANSWCSDRFNDGQQLELEVLSLKPLRDSKIGFFYSISKVDEGFSLRFFYSRGCFQIDYDTTYLFEFRNDLNPNIDMNEITKEEIAQVIKKRIHHPALHTHLKREDGGNYYHHLRFGFATNNPFVILYQVAFQIIEYQNRNSKMKEGEVCRLAEILYSNKDRPEISAGILFPN
jgi:hypothetical protein